MPMDPFIVRSLIGAGIGAAGFAATAKPGHRLRSALTGAGVGAGAGMLSGMGKPLQDGFHVKWTYNSSPMPSSGSSLKLGSLKAAGSSAALEKFGLHAHGLLNGEPLIHGLLTGESPDRQDMMAGAAILNNSRNQTMALIQAQNAHRFSLPYGYGGGGGGGGPPPGGGGGGGAGGSAGMHMAGMHMA